MKSPLTAQMSATIEEVQSLISKKRTGVLATVSEGKPFASLTNFAFDGESGALVFLLSRLAKHTKNLENLPHVSLLVEDDKINSSHPLDKPRVTITGKIHKVGEETERKRCKEVFLAANPDSKMFLTMRDFEFYLLEPEEIYFVRGFGSVAQFTSLKA